MKHANGPTDTISLLSVYFMLSVKRMHENHLSPL